MVTNKIFYGEKLQIFKKDLQVEIPALRTKFEISFIPFRAPCSLFWIRIHAFLIDC
jgi:hypothetical protein